MKTDFEYIIIGAGPAGVQLAYFLGQEGRDYAVLEREVQHVAHAYPIRAAM